MPQVSQYNSRWYSAITRNVLQHTKKQLTFALDAALNRIVTELYTYSLNTSTSTIITTNINSSTTITISYL